MEKKFERRWNGTIAHFLSIKIYEKLKFHDDIINSETTH